MKCEKSENSESTLSAASNNNGLTIQRKLSVGPVDDPMEDEAESTADKIMRMPQQNLVQRKCAHCEEEEKLQRKPLASFIQKKELTNNNVVASDNVSSQIQSSKGNGNSMPESTKSFMESRFGTDFSDVRIHSNNNAAQLSNQLSAQAFTVGNDIYFNEGKYQPESEQGKHLLAHELTHTIQQNAENGSRLQRMIQVNPGLDLDTQGFSTSKTGNVYTCPAVVKGSVWNEIFTSLLHSSRVFKVAGKTNAAVNENFAKHMKARYGVTEFASKKQYVFPKKATGEIMNPAYWQHDATGWHEKPGADRKKAIDDLNINPKDYEIGCLLATRLTMEGGSKSQALEREVGVADDDWIPGDWGYIKNTKFSGGYGLSGENIIYTGKDLFWGHFGAGNTYKSLVAWFADVESWDGEASINTHRDHTNVGLE